MAIAFSKNKYAFAVAPTPVLGRFSWRFLASISGGFKAPSPGDKPHDLCVSRRAWKRHSALLMSFYEQNRL